MGEPLRTRPAASIAWACVVACFVPAPLAAAGVAFPVEATEATAGSARVVAFRIEAAAEEDRTLETRSDRPGSLEVLAPGRVLRGETIGFARVRGRAPGGATLTVGGVDLAVEVRPQASGPLTRARTPRVTAPPAGAVLWGTVGVGARWTDDTGTIDPAAARLRLPDGTRLVPVEHAARGSDGWAAFDLDTATLPEGDHVLVVERPAGELLPARESEPLPIRVVRAAGVTALAGEAEESFDAARPLPERLGGDRKPILLDDADASGGRAWVNNAPRPAVAAAVDVGGGGWYQAIARVRGSFSTGGFPAVGFGVDAEQRVRAAGNSMGERWHRIAVGPPVWLDAPPAGGATGDTEDRPGWLGDAERLVSFRFVNDHALPGNRGKPDRRLPREDRNLVIDAWELARLPEAPGLSLPAPGAASPGRGDEADRLRVSLDPLPAGTRVSGGFRVRGQAAAPGGRPVRTTLRVNGDPLAEQEGALVVFDVPASSLRPGDNTLQLVASADRAEATSEVLSVRAPVAAAAPGAGRASVRFPVDGASWSREPVAGPGPGQTQRTTRGTRHAEFAFTSNATAELTLPRELAGRFRGFAEGRSQHFEGPPRFRVELATAAGVADLGEHPFRGGEAGFGAVDLPAGPKTLRFSFVNDKRDAATKKDRNLWLSAIRFAEPAGADREPPVAELRWPASGERLGGYAPLVVDVADARGVVRVQALVGGEPAGPAFPVDPGRGRITVPLVLRGLDGDRAVSVRVQDAAGNTTETPRVPVRVSGERTPRVAEAVFVLNRLGFGPEPAALAEALIEGPEAWALRRLAGDADAATALSRAAAAQPDDFNRGQVQRRGLSWLLQHPDPLAARQVAFLDNHLSTWIHKAEPERQAAAFGDWVEAHDQPFFELLYASATSPAMLRYLDQQRSFVRRINENYAREILELHTVGVGGGYTQKDVTALATALTGLSAGSAVSNAPIGQRRRNVFAFVPNRHDPRAVRAFGLELPAVPTEDKRPDPVAAYDRVRVVLEALAAHPATADFLADKLANHHLGPAGEGGDGGVRAAMASAFLRTHGRLPAVLAEMVRHPTFRAAARRAAAEGPTAGARVARPLDAAVRLQRVTGQVEPGAAARYLNGAGFGLFDRESPDGYPDEDAAHADSNATLQRWRYASVAAPRILTRLPASLRNPPPAKVRRDGGLAAWRQRLVDTLAGTLTGGLLSETSNAAALSILERPGEAVGGGDVRTVTALISQLPEGALR